MMYLHESDVSCKALAIDLCSRGFAVWQHYIDAMEMIRSLFNLATSSKKESINAQNIGPQARQAVLHVVTNNTGIFMTTLSLDILHPQSLEHRKSVLQLVAFLTRKVRRNRNFLRTVQRHRRLLRNLSSSILIFPSSWKRW